MFSAKSKKNKHYLRVINFFLQHGFKSWQFISSFYYTLNEKSCLILDMLGEVSFFEMQPTMLMMELDNLIKGKTHESN